MARSALMRAARSICCLRFSAQSCAATELRAPRFMGATKFSGESELAGELLCCADAAAVRAWLKDEKSGQGDSALASRWHFPWRCGELKGDKDRNILEICGSPSTVVSP